MQLQLRSCQLLTQQNLYKGKVRGVHLNNDSSHFRFLVPHMKAFCPKSCVFMVSWGTTEVVSHCLPQVPGWGSVNLSNLFTSRPSHRTSFQESVTHFNRLIGVCPDVKWREDYHSYLLWQVKSALCVPSATNLKSVWFTNLVKRQCFHLVYSYTAFWLLQSCVYDMTYLRSKEPNYITRFWPLSTDWALHEWEASSKGNERQHWEVNS